MEKRLLRDVGYTVHTRRTLLGITRAELAERSGLSVTCLRQLEHGELDIGLGALGLLAKALECDAGDLLPRKGRSPIQSMVGDAYNEATDSVRHAVVFMLGAEGSTSRRDLFARLVAELPPPSSSTPLPTPPTPPKRPSKPTH